MDDIPDIQKDLIKHSVALSKGRKVAARAESVQTNEPIPTGQDSVEVSPMSKWLEILKEMPDEYVDKAMNSYRAERLEEVAKKLKSGFYDDKFDEEIFPGLFNELTDDWDINFGKDKPKN